VVTSRGVLARQRHRDSLDGDGGTGDDLEVAEPADDGLRQASPRGHEGDECNPCLARVGEERRRRCVVTGVFWWWTALSTASSSASSPTSLVQQGRDGSGVLVVGER